MGSSPLTRGKLRAEDERPRREGLIPAHAGKTDWPGRLGGDGRAHPRSRGENAHRRRPPMCRQGSSPLTRGKRLNHVQPLPVVGLIPAHAGKTRGRRAGCSRDWAHPRSRGENSLWFGTDASTGGSSPLTRGKLELRLTAAIATGLIPAHAGKTAARGRSKPAYGAHPRSRGENDGAGSE